MENEVDEGELPDYDSLALYDEKVIESCPDYDQFAMEDENIIKSYHKGVKHTFNVSEDICRGKGGTPSS